VNTGQIKPALHLLEQDHFFDLIHEIMSNTTTVPQGLCTVWIILKYSMAERLGTQTKDKQRISLNSIFGVTTALRLGAHWQL